MNRISVVTAVASAYAAIAATSFALGFLLAPAKTQAGEGEIIVREAPPFSLSRQMRPDRITAGADNRNDRMLLQKRSVRIGSVQAPAAINPFDLQDRKNIGVVSGAAVD